MTESTESAKETIWNSPDLEAFHGYQCPYCGSSNLKKFLSLEEQMVRDGYVFCKPQGELTVELKGIPLAKVLCGDCWRLSYIALKE